MMTGYPVTTMVHTGTTVTTSSTVIAAANPKRMYLYVQNMGLVDVYIREDGGTAIADKTAYRLSPRQGWHFHPMPASSVTAIAASGTCDIHVISGGEPVPAESLEVVVGGVTVVVGGDVVHVQA